MSCDQAYRVGALGEERCCEEPTPAWNVYNTAFLCDPVAEAYIRLGKAMERVWDAGVMMPVEALDTPEKQRAWLAVGPALAAMRDATKEGT